MNDIQRKFEDLLEEVRLEERERCAKVAYKAAEDADYGHDRETEAGKQARKIGNAIRFSLAEGGEA
jgi:hypothetical protein